MDCKQNEYYNAIQGKCVKYQFFTGTPNTPKTNIGNTQENTENKSGNFGDSYFGGLLQSVFGNLALGFGQGAGQSLNPQQQQPNIVQERRDNTVLIVIIAVVVIGVVIMFTRKK